MGKDYEEEGHFAGENHASFMGGNKEYGSNWQKVRKDARKRDNYTCQDCGKTEKDLGTQLSVHHIIPIVLFENAEDANCLSNLISICEHPCHRLRHSGEGHPTNYANEVKKQSEL